MKDIEINNTYTDEIEKLIRLNKKTDYTNASIIEANR